jgi:hypothetical protein
MAITVVATDFTLTDEKKSKLLSSFAGLSQMAPPCTWVYVY